MRIALAQLDLGMRLAGVDRALAGQVRAARATGVPLDVLVIHQGAAGVEKGVRYVPCRPVPRPLRRLSRLVRARLLASADLSAYDVVFLRYPTAIDLDPLAFLRGTRARVATVHHAKEALELMSGGRTAGALARAALELVQGARVLRAVDGIVGVTDELRDFQLARAGGGVPAETIANGVDVGAIEPGGFTPFDGSVLRLVFVASTLAPWHGTDRLVWSLRRHRGLRVHLDLVGGGTGAPRGTEEHLGSVTVRHHGMLSGPELGRVLSAANLAVSTLAFHRTGLREGAVLKTREYLARGIPVVLGYEDVDVPADLPFVLQVPNDDSVLSVDLLADFAERSARRPDAAAEIRAYAERVLDWTVKVGRYERFAARLLQAPPRHGP